jgi:hypothetical protein
MSCIECLHRPTANGRHCDECWMAGNIAAEVASYGRPEPFGAAHPARSSDRCPLCPEPIEEGVSWIVRIVERLPGVGVTYDSKHGCHRDTATGQRVRMHRRSRAHADCVERERGAHRPRLLTQRKGS